jgi:hypothetical protein
VKRFNILSWLNHHSNGKPRRERLALVCQNGLHWLVRLSPEISAKNILLGAGGFGIARGLEPV